jgi:hypothetical protein
MQDHDTRQDKPDYISSLGSHRRKQYGCAPLANQHKRHLSQYDRPNLW